MQWACFWHEVWFNSSHYHWVYVLFFSSPTANETRCWITEGVSMKEQRWLQQSHMDVGTPWAFLYDAAELSAHHAILCVCTWHLLLWYLVNTHYLRWWKRDHFSYSFFFSPLHTPVCGADTTQSSPACTRSGWRLPDPPHFNWWKTELGISIPKTPGDFSCNLVKENRKKKVEQHFIQCAASEPMACFVPLWW